jgi:hypothetical protein
MARTIASTDVVRARARGSGPVRVCISGALLLQAALLVWMYELPLPAAACLLTAGAVASLLSAWVWRHGRGHVYRDMALTTLTFGGLGMLIGTYLDAPGAAPACHHHHDAGFLFSWMTLLMLACCVPACVVLCEPCRGPRGRWSSCAAHTAATAGMLLGMWFVGARFTPVLARIVAEPVASHVAMLAGMTVGTLLGLFAVTLSPGRGRP